MVVPGNFSFKHSSRSALRGLCIYFNRWNFPQHGRKPRRSGNNSGYSKMENLPSRDNPSRKTCNSFDNFARFWKFDGKLSCSALFKPRNAFYKICRFEFWTCRRSQRYCSNNDGFWNCNPSFKSKKHFKPSEFYNRNWKIRPNFKSKSRKSRKIFNRFYFYRSYAFYKHLSDYFVRH